MTEQLPVSGNAKNYSWSSYFLSPAIVDLVAGGIAGAVSRTFVSPLERIKILYQVQPSDEIARRSVMTYLKNIYKHEGFLGYFKGNGTNVIRIFPYSAVQFASYAKYKKILLNGTNRELVVFERLLAGAASGITSVTVTYPLDLIRTRLSLSLKEPGLHSSSGNGIFSVGRNIIMSEGGFLQLYRGLLPTVLGIAPYVALNFTIYETLKGKLVKMQDCNEDLSVLSKLTCGGISGAVSQIITYPLDVLRRRMQVAGLPGGSFSHYPTSFVKVIPLMFKEEGFFGFYKGVYPNLLKVVPSIALRVMLEHALVSLLLMHVCFLNCQFMVVDAWNINRKFKESGISVLSDSGLPSTGYHVANGDVNSDRFVDAFVLNEQRNQLTVYLWNHVKNEYVSSQDYVITLDQQNFIVNVVPSDFMHEGHLDVLLSFKDAKESSLIKHKLYKGSKGDFEFAMDLQWSNSQLFLFDYSGQMRVDMLGIRDNDLYLWKNVHNGNSVTLEYKIEPLTNFSVSNGFCVPDLEEDPSRVALVDMKGNCRADIFMVCTATTDIEGESIKIGDLYAEIWSVDVSPSNNFPWKKTAKPFKLPPGARAFAFEDVDGDGAVDIVFKNCNLKHDSNDCSEIVVYFNLQLPFCSTDNSSSSFNDDRDCKNVLCGNDENPFGFDPDSDHAVLKIPVPGLKFKSALFPDSAVPIRFGDFNLDSFPDIVLWSESLGLTIWENVKCTNDDCTSALTSAKRRTFRHLDASYANFKSSLSGYSDVSASYLDIYHDGMLDLIVNGISNGSPSLFVLRNHVYRDAYFLKVTILNAACYNGKCGPRSHGYGVNLPGGTVKYRVKEDDGSFRIRANSQMPQTYSGSLNRPGTHFGLSRINTFVERLAVGVTNHQLSFSYYKVWSIGIIPNSEIVCIPPNDGSGEWKMELYVLPEDVVMVLIAVIVTICCFSIAAFIFHRLEKREDNIERKKALHVINFDAL